MLPDGTVITRLVTTKHIIDRVTEHAVSDEVIQPEESEFIQTQKQPEALQQQQPPPSSPTREQITKDEEEFRPAGWGKSVEPKLMFGFCRA